MVLEEFEEVVEEPNPEEPDRPVGTPVAVTVKVPLKEDWGESLGKPCILKMLYLPNFKSVADHP